MQIDHSVQFVALKKRTMEITSSLIQQLTQNEVREFLFYFFVAGAFSYVWGKEAGVLLFVGVFMVALYGLTYWR